MRPTKRAAGCACMALSAWLSIGGALAAHPLITEDTPTQGAGKQELEFDNAWTRVNEVRAYEFGPQWSLGLADTVDAIVRPSLVEFRSMADGGSQERGFGDTTVDLKWRFLDVEAYSLAVRAGVSVPTGNAARGLGAGRTNAHGLLAATLVAVAPLVVHANLGYAENRGDPALRARLYHASAATVLNLGPRLRWLLADIAVDSDPDASVRRWQSVIRTGAIWVVRPGFDLDLGYQTHLARSGFGSVLLAGATVRW